MSEVHRHVSGFLVVAYCWEERKGRARATFYYLQYTAMVRCVLPYRPE